MRIAVSSNFFPPRTGGSAHLSAALARQYVARGHEVLVLTAAYKDAPAVEERDGYRVVRLPAFGLPQVGLKIDFDISFTSRPGNLRRVFRLLDDFKPDVLHQHGHFLDLTWLTGWYARRRHLPTLLTLHTMLLSDDPKYSALFKALDRFLVRPALGLYPFEFVTMDKMGQDYAVERYGNGCKFNNIPIAVDLGRFGNDNSLDIRDKYDLGQGPLIVSLGHVIPLRDRIPLINALPTVLEHHPDTKVLVAGRVYYDAFLKRAEELGVSDAVVVAGQVPSHEVPAYFAAADVVAHDLTLLGCGTASLEAMAAGRATVSAVPLDHYPGIELRNWDNALRIDPGDAPALAKMLVRLLDDPDERARIAQRQRQLVHDHFTLDVVTEAHLDAMARLVADAELAAVGGAVGGR